MQDLGLHARLPSGGVLAFLVAYRSGFQGIDEAGSAQLHPLLPSEEDTGQPTTAGRG